jgi:hypothetical protein
MEEPVENEQVQWVRDLLVGWLGRDDWEPQHLIDWLQSYGLPVSSEDEPFLWLLRALPPADELYSAKQKLASRAAEVLASKPDEARPGDEPNKVLLNLFYLCAGLACADELAEPLYDVYQRRELKGRWSGIDLRDALRAALTTNQIDRRLESVWQAMVEGKGDDSFSGDAEDGFEGLAFMPRSRDYRGEPALDAIGWALKVVGEKSEHEVDREANFQKLIERITTVHPGYAWDVCLLTQAQRYEWPLWTVEQLPGSCPRRASLYLQASPNVRPREFKALIHQAIIDAKLEVDGDHRVAESLEEAHRESLKCLCVGGSVD